MSIKYQRNKAKRHYALRYKILCLLAVILLSITGCSDRDIHFGGVSDQDFNLRIEKESTENKESFDSDTVTKTVSESGSKTKKMSETEKSTDRKIVIELDPGHGGNQSGAQNMNTGILEKNINLKIAKYLKADLELYRNVKVHLTRTKDINVKLEERVQKAVADKADILISLHNNAAGPMADYKNGCTVLTARGAYNKENSRIGQEAGCYILDSLSQIGLQNQGLMFRICQNKERYPNGKLCDYYNIVRNSELSGIPGIIVEHGFMDNESDFEKFLSDDEKIMKIAQADADGIAAYFKLKGKKESKRLKALQNHEEKVTIVKSDDKKDNAHIMKTYFAE